MALVNGCIFVAPFWIAVAAFAMGWHTVGLIIIVAYISGWAYFILNDKHKYDVEMDARRDLDKAP